LSHTSNIDRLGPSLERLPRLTSHNTEQSHRGSNPCLHLERVGRYVQGVQSGAVLPGQKGCLVQPVRSIGPSIAEKMDNWMDNFEIPDASVAALSVLPDILLTSSQHAFWAQVRAHQTCRSALRPGWRRTSFWRVVLQSVGDARSPIRGALTSLATPSHCGLRRTLCAPGKPIRQPCCSREFHAPGTAHASVWKSQWGTA
jgi:hypothetical protein